MAEAINFNKITHVIFDLDGTILDTEKLYEKIFEQLVKRHGKTISKNLRQEFIGSPAITACEFLLNRLNLPISLDHFHNELQEIVSEVLVDSELMPGAEKLIKHLHKHNIPMSIGTNSEIESVKIKMMKYGEIYRLFHHVVCGDDVGVGRSKPEPDIFLLCARLFDEDIKEENILVFEDSYVGVQAAVKAGMQVVMIPSPSTPPEHTQDATIVIQSLEHFKPEHFGLPKFDETS